MLVFSIISGIVVVADAGVGTSVPGPIKTLEETEGVQPLTDFPEACVPSQCFCNKVQGQFCGDEKINPACLGTHAYECNGKTGHACDYGFRASCAHCHKLNC
ncbi:hypothetical protein M378DRAFT_22612 [Amanita muscaria Koide BX008]|uniref:Uncharacterized protein n=1 Tax=Amanita muscaria (strain Koide BX008) TaxID=946122 RepID=A0A0C2SWW4_AMAMK|nr:hypothetical protein M378DRAFT_22612 [Amanita muscaria Koide BX008]